MFSHLYEKIGPSSSFIFVSQRTQACDPIPYLSSAPVHALLENVVPVLFPGTTLPVKCFNLKISRMPVNFRKQMSWLMLIFLDC